MTKDKLLKLVTVLQAELEATNRQVEILSDVLAESRREVAALKVNAALDKKAENARELGLDYEPPCKTGSQCTSKCQQCVVQEPVAWVTGFYAGRCVIKTINPAAILPVGVALYTTPPTAPAQPAPTVQEPDLIARLKRPEDHYEFTDPKKANAVLMSLCQEAAEALAVQHEPVFKPCSCRWKGEEQVQQCTLHAAHIEAIHEWAERAKTAEAKLKEKTND